MKKTDDPGDEVSLRMQKRQNLIEAGTDPYPDGFDRSMENADLAEKYRDLPAGEETGDRVRVAGRIYSIRNSGMFMDVHDASGKIQAFCHKSSAPEKVMKLLPLVDIGDFIGIEGIVRRTPRGELSVKVDALAFLCKALRPMPEKYHGLADVETRYRKRYLDIMSNADSRKRFRQRSRILRDIRTFMEESAFTEVETPMLQPVYGGASASPFVTHHNALDRKMYLRIAPELYLKRVLVSGMADRVYEVNRNFRNEGLSTRHNPEFTMLEAYAAYWNCGHMMTLVERLFHTLATGLHGSARLAIGDAEIDFTPPFRRISMHEEVRRRTGLDFMSMHTDEEAHNAAAGAGYEPDAGSTWGETLAHVFDKCCESLLVQPVHVTDFPKDISPFAKTASGDSRLVERFETYCNGWEICNAFTELNDPVEQRARILEQTRQDKKRGDSEREPDEDFLEAMEHGMPPAGGLGIGIDRLVMLLTGCESIRDVILFPTLKKT